MVKNIEIIARSAPGDIGRARQSNIGTYKVESPYKYFSIFVEGECVYDTESIVLSHVVRRVADEQEKNRRIIEELKGQVELLTHKLNIAEKKDNTIYHCYYCGETIDTPRVVCECCFKRVGEQNVS